MACCVAFGESAREAVDWLLLMIFVLNWLAFVRASCNHSCCCTLFASFVETAARWEDDLSRTLESVREDDCGIDDFDKFGGSEGWAKWIALFVLASGESLIAGDIVSRGTSLRRSLKGNVGVVGVELEIMDDREVFIRRLKASSLSENPPRSGELGAELTT